MVGRPCRSSGSIVEFEMSPQKKKKKLCSCNLETRTSFFYSEVLRKPSLLCNKLINSFQREVLPFIYGFVLSVFKFDLNKNAHTFSSNNKNTFQMIPPYQSFGIQAQCWDFSAKVWTVCCFLLHTYNITCCWCRSAVRPYHFLSLQSHSASWLCHTGKTLIQPWP